MRLRWLVLVSLVAACTDAPVVRKGNDTGSTCPPIDPPSYASFGQSFFASYCTECHSQTSLDRQGAPLTIDFDTRSLVRENTSGIDKEAAFGPTAMNRFMPNMNHEPVPTDNERVRLGEYIACEIGR